MVKAYFFSFLIMTFILEPQTILADFKNQDVDAKFDKAASKIITRILIDHKKNINRIIPILFFAPYAGPKVPDVPAKTLKKYHSIFEDRLIENATGRSQIETSDNVKVNSEAGFKKAHYFLTAEIIRFGDTIDFTYRVKSLKSDKVIGIARTQVDNLSPFELEDSPVAVSLSKAVEEAAETFVSGNNDIKTLYYNFLSSEGKGFSSEFDQVFIKDLIQKMEERISNPLTQRKVRIVFNRTNKQKLRIGAYHLTGTSKTYVKNMYVSLQLNDQANKSTLWRGYITRSSLGNLAFEEIEYKELLEKLRLTDRHGSLKFDLTTSLGNDPTFYFGDKWHLEVKTNKTAWLYCFYYMANKKTIQIYPNHATWQVFGGPKIYSGEPISIPRKYKKDGFKVDFTTSEPAGYELIKCFSTTKDITADLPEQLRGRDTIEEGGRKVPPALTNDIDKILSVEFRKRDPNLTEKSIAVTVIKGP